MAVGVEDNLKVCTACDQTKALDQFCLNGTGRRHSWCNDCRKVKKRNDYKVRKSKLHTIMVPGSTPRGVVPKKPQEPVATTDADEQVKRAARLRLPDERLIDAVERFQLLRCWKTEQGMGQNGQVRTGING